MSRMKKRRKRKKRSQFNPKKWKRIVILGMTIWGIGLGFKFMYQSVFPIVMGYAKTQTINIATLVIKEGIGRSELMSFKMDDVIKFQERDDGTVSSILVNTPVLNRLLVSATQQVEEKLLLVETGDLTELGLDAIYGGPYEDGVLINVPLAAAFNLSLFHDIGPKFPVTVKINGSAITDIVTEVKTYGINNALLEILLKVTVNMYVGLPFKSEEVTVTVSSPLVLKMITGDIPQYYYIGSSLTSPLSPFTNESGKNPQSGSTIPAPDASPEQSVESGMENILLQ